MKTSWSFTSQGAMNSPPVPQVLFTTSSLRRHEPIVFAQGNLRIRFPGGRCGGSNPQWRVMRSRRQALLTASSSPQPHGNGSVAHGVESRLPRHRNRTGFVFGGPEQPFDHPAPTNNGGIGDGETIEVTWKHRAWILDINQQMEKDLLTDRVLDLAIP